MRTMISDYRSRPGDHCGSVAMRSLLQHYCGLDLPEAVVFGLGSGLDSVYLASPAMDPHAAVFGRTANMEVDVGRALGIDYRERPEPDDAHAFEVVREEVLAGRPTMLTGDIFYLDYREFKVHFPSHRFVLLGFDDASSTVYIADRIRPEPEACSYAALAASRNPPEGISTHNLWGSFHDTTVQHRPEDAMRGAIERCARRMLSGQSSGFEALAQGDGSEVVSGVAATLRYAEVLPTWADRDDVRWLASFNAQCIEKFGNGGGNFRRLYAGFLKWARAIDPAVVPEHAPALAWKAADGWTALAGQLSEAAEADVDADFWERAAEQARHVAAIETALFEALLD